MKTISKMTEEQVEIFLGRNDLSWEDHHSSYVRECSCCNHYVNVNHISSEVEVNNQIHFDVCDDCEKGLVVN